MSVDVIMRTKDRPVLLRRAIRSVLAQTHVDWRLILVNDGGRREVVDDVVAKIGTDDASRIHVRHVEASRGMEAASNLGISLSESEWIVIHDDDDSWDPSFLERMLAAAERPTGRGPTMGVVSHSLFVVETLREDAVEILSERPFRPWLREVTLFGMAARNLFPPISFVFRRQAYEAVGPYREDLPVVGDWDFNLRFVQRFDIDVLPETLARYHHRVDLQASDDVYANSLTDRHEIHLDYDRRLRNEYLRADLHDGRFGMGVLMNVAREVVALPAPDPVCRRPRLHERLLRSAKGLFG